MYFWQSFVYASFATITQYGMILHQSSEQGVIDKDETEMLRDVFRFSDKRANDLMTYRRDIVVLHPTDTPEEVLRIIHEEHFSKYLLVERGKDEIIGVVSVKDIILMMGGEQPFNLRSIARPALFIPESLYAKKVLELFKKNKNKFGVVWDRMVHCLTRQTLLIPMFSEWP